MPTAVFCSRNRHKRRCTARLHRFTCHSSVIAKRAPKKQINTPTATVEYAQTASNIIANTERANGTSSTVADVIGKRIIPQQSPQLLAGTLANAVVFQGNQASAIPPALQHQFTYSLSDAYGNPVLSYTEKLSKLVGKRLTLSYVPATPADAATIASYLPKPHADGSPILPSELPTSLPGYLINLKPQINLDGVAVATSAQALPMGTDLSSTGGFTQLYDPTQWDLTSEQSNTVGQATAIGISAGGIGAAQLSQLKDRLAATQTQLQAAAASPANAAALLAKLTGEQISGDLLTATIWSWFAAAESHNVEFHPELTPWGCGQNLGLLGGSSCIHMKSEFVQSSFT